MRLILLFTGLGGSPTLVFNPKKYRHTTDNKSKGSEDAGDDVFYGVVWFGIIDADAYWGALASWVGEGSVMVVSGAHCDRLGREQRV